MCVKDMFLRAKHYLIIFFQFDSVCTNAMYRVPAPSILLVGNYMCCETTETYATSLNINTCMQTL